MFDHIAPTVFWPLFALAWLAVSLVVGIFVGKVLRWSAGDEFDGSDRVAESQRRIARNGFKSRQGIR